MELKVQEASRATRIKKRLSQALLAFDAWVNSAVYNSGRKSRAAYAGFSAFMDRFHVRGWPRLGVELACETLTLGLGGALLALFLATPAFQETSDDWLKKQDLAVTFLDRYGTEVGRRGIKHDDSITLDQLPEHLIQAVLATEDRRFYEHWGIDVIGTRRAITAPALPPMPRPRITRIQAPMPAGECAASVVTPATLSAPPRTQSRISSRGQPCSSRCASRN